MACNWVKMEGGGQFGMRRIVELQGEYSHSHSHSQWWRKGPWSSDEDKLLTDYVRLHGEGRWNCVATLTGLKRNGKSCRLRWVNYLRPDLKRCQITPHEETIILDLHARWGNRWWSTIARSLPGRTDNEIKNYWRTHFKNKSTTKMHPAARCGSSHDDDDDIKARKQRLLMKKQQFQQQQQQQQQEQIINHQQLDDDMVMYLLNNETKEPASMIRPCCTRPAAAADRHQMAPTSSSSCCYNNFTLNNIANDDIMLWDIGSTSCLWNLLHQDDHGPFPFPSMPLNT